jgi:hypothetical protein
MNVDKGKRKVSKKKKAVVSEKVKEGKEIEHPGKSSGSVNKWEDRMLSLEELLDEGFGKDGFG